MAVRPMTASVLRLSSSSGELVKYRAPITPITMNNHEINKVFVPIISAFRNVSNFKFVNRALSAHRYKYNRNDDCLFATKSHV